MKELRRRNSKYKQKKEIKLFYLTKFGDMPSDSSLSTLNKEDISLLSFSLDIEWWLSECIKKTNITKLQESIKQYQVHISELPDSDAGVVPDTFAMRFSRV